MYEGVLDTTLLTHFMPLVSFYTPENRFSDIFKGIERDNWHEMV